MVTIEKAIKQWQAETGINNKKMADMLGTSLQYVGRLISGKVNFGRNTAYKWHDTFGFNPEYLMVGAGDLLSPDANSVNNFDNLAAAAEPQREVLTLDKSTVTEMLLTLTRAVDKQADIIQELRHQEIKKAGLPDSSQKVG